ncbi:hypothetical protein GCM10010488_03490 [Oerskovia jenensis]
MWVNPAVGRITSGFGMRTSPTDGVYRLHSGTDIGAPSGAPIWAATAGTVTFSGFQTGGGNMVKIAHPGGIETWYLHMTARHVTVGAQVATGQQIGTIGSTGNSTGPHLHFETRVNGNPQNPVPFMTARGVTLGSGTPTTNPTPTPDPEPVPDVQEDNMVVILNKSNNAAIVVSGGKSAPVIGWDMYVTLTQTLPSLGVTNEQFNAFAASFA